MNEPRVFPYCSLNFCLICTMSTSQRDTITRVRVRSSVPAPYRDAVMKMYSTTLSLSFYCLACCFSDKIWWSQVRHGKVLNTGIYLHTCAQCWGSPKPQLAPVTHSLSRCNWILSSTATGTLILLLAIQYIIIPSWTCTASEQNRKSCHGHTALDG